MLYIQVGVVFGEPLLWTSFHMLPNKLEWTAAAVDFITFGKCNTRQNLLSKDQQRLQCKTDDGFDRGA